MNTNTNKVMVRNMLAVMALLAAASAQAQPGYEMCPEGRAAAGGPLQVVCPAAGPYVIINSLKEGEVDFKYGWHNAKKMDPPPCAYFIQLYDQSLPGSVWATEVSTLDPPKLLKLRGSEDFDSVDNTLMTGHTYSVNFFVRDQCDPALPGGVTNSTVIELWFEAP